MRIGATKLLIEPHPARDTDLNSRSGASRKADLLEKMLASSSDSLRAVVAERRPGRKF